MTNETSKAMQMREFSRRLQAELLDKEWNQSDLARAAGIGRDSVSGYILERNLPGPNTLKRIAEALQMKPYDLLPSERGRKASSGGSAGARDDIFQCVEVGPDRVSVNLSKVLTKKQAQAIMRIVFENDD